MGELTINEAIDGEIECGGVDPREIADSVLKKYSAEWLAAQLVAEAHEILSDRARYQLGLTRRRAVGGGVKRTEKYRPAAFATFASAPVYVPKVGWRQNGDLTYDECLSVAAAYHRRGDEMHAWADRYQFFAKLIKKQRVRTLGEVAGVEALPEAA